MPARLSQPPDADTWRRLIGPALRVVDSLRDSGYGELDFRLGGGTVLMFRFGHRISKDIDIFTYDAQALGLLSPRLNEIAETDEGLAAILRGEGDTGSHLRAVFGDTSLQALADAGASQGVPLGTILAAYAAARTSAAAANPELDAALAGDW